MAKNGFLNWVGYKGEEPEPTVSSVDRIRDLEEQLAEMRSRRDIRALSKEELEILATETAVAMVKSAQIREAKAQATADRLLSESMRESKSTVESAREKAQTILNSAEARSRKLLKTAEEEAEEKIAQADATSSELLESRKREGNAFLTNARRKSEQILSTATTDIVEYRQWLNSVMSEASRLYKIQTQSLDAAQEAIQTSRSRLETAYEMLADLQAQVLEKIKEDGTLVKSKPIQVKSERTKAAINAPKKSSKSNKK